jgi:F0F1-type ATP synthase assembly protein I
LLWQLAVTAALTLLAGMMAGAHAALSAALGGAVSLCAGCSSAVVAARGKAPEGKVSAGGILVGALLAEGVKLGVMLVMLGVAFAAYRQIVATAFLGTFVATAVIFSMAFFVREYK